MIEMILIYLFFPFAAWLIYAFVGKDILVFRGIRREVLHAIEHTANVSQGFSTEEQYRQSVDLLRSLGTRLNALGQTLNPAARYYFHMLGYDLDKSHRNLIGLSNSLGDFQWNRMAHRYAIEKGLRFSHEASREEIEETRSIEQKRPF